MAQKRASPESSYDNQATEISDAAAQQVESGKRGKLASLNDTTLHDLPTEMLERVLFQAVLLEVKDMKMIKSVWEEKADLVIRRLGTVCSQWNSILTADFFRDEIHRTLDDTAQEEIRLEILHQSEEINYFVIQVAAMKDEILVFCQAYDAFTGYTYNIRVYDRNNTTRVKHIIPLRDTRPTLVATCHVSNCVYMLKQNRELLGSSLLRITISEKYEPSFSTLISDLGFDIPYMSVSLKDGMIVILAPARCHTHAVCIFNPDGVLQRQVILSGDIYGFKYVESVIQKSNGNLVLACVSKLLETTMLLEIDSNGIIERQYESESGSDCVSIVDNSGRILITADNGFELLDSELNFLDFIRLDRNQYDFESISELHFNSERNEVVGFRVNENSTPLVIFRFS